jgi:predicted outer membrane protein
MRTNSVVVVVLSLFAVSGCRRPDGQDGPVSEPFGDPQVAGLAVVLTDHQVLVGMEAISIGLQVPEISAYAIRVVAEQSAARDRLLETAAAQGINVDQSTTEAHTNLQDTMTDVANHQPDGNYIQDSVHDIGKAIEVWNNTLLPNVHNAALRAELDTTLQLLQASFAAGSQLLVDFSIPPKPI